MARNLFLDDYCEELSRYTDAPKIFFPASIYATVGALLTRRFYKTIVDVGPGRWTNLWILLVGDSGAARKTFVADQAIQILHNADPDVKGPNSGSTEGFLRALQKSGDPAMLIYQPEFGSLLGFMGKQYVAELKPVLMEIFDVPIQYRRTLSKEDWVIQQPRLSILSCGTPKKLEDFARRDDWFSGFFSRFLIIKGENFNPRRETTLPPTFHGRYVKRLDDILKIRRKLSEAPEGGRLKLSSAAADIGDHFISPQDLSDHEETQSALSRACHHWSKIAAIEQVLEDPSTDTIGVDAAGRAATFIHQWIKGMVRIVQDASTDSTVASNLQIDKSFTFIRNAIERNIREKKSPFVTVRDLQAYGPVRSRKLVMENIESLKSMGKIRTEQSKDRSDSFVILLADQTD